MPLIHILLYTHQYIYPNNSAYPRAACLCLWITWNRDLYLNNFPPLQNYCAFLRSFLSSIRYKRGEGRRNSLWFTCVYFKEQMQQFPTNLFCMLTKIAIFLWKDPKNDKNGFKRPTTLIFQLKYHKPSTLKEVSVLEKFYNLIFYSDIVRKLTDVLPAMKGERESNSFDLTICHWHHLIFPPIQES